jgi:hypothetical protein
MENSVRISAFSPFLARLRFSWSMTIIPSLDDGGRLAAELIDRSAILVVFRRFRGMGAADSVSFIAF